MIELKFTMIITIRFSPCIGMYFDQQYKVTDEQPIDKIKFHTT